MVDFIDPSSGPHGAILLDRAHGTLRDGSSNHGEDYGVSS
jgi:hypothetical protein